MKFVFGLLAVTLALNAASALPAKSDPADDAEVIDVNRSHFSQRDNNDDSGFDTNFKSFRGVIDTGDGFPFLQPRVYPQPSVFGFNSGFFDSFDDIFRRLRSRLWPVGIPGAGGSDDSSEGNFGFNLDPKKGNTTSTVKVVDGHKIEVNETTYGDADSVYKVRIVNIRPLDSDEDTGAGAGDSSTTATNVGVNPVTAGPGEEPREDREDRREPLEKDSSENDINDAEHSEIQALNIMLPTRNDDNAADLNAAFVTDNSLEEEDAENGSGSGNIEAETNKPDYDSRDEQMASYGILAEEPAEDGDAASSLVENDGLTIENNEETEVNDNFNESSEDGTATMPAVTEEDSAEKLEAVEQIDSGHEFAAPGEDAAADSADVVDHEAAVNSRATHSNYNMNKQREDVSSSDDEGEAEAATEMSPEFQSEWENLAEELANVNDRNNDLSNDIDNYDSVPVDLSNDIAVNDAAANNPEFPLNPDAEFIEGAAGSSSMPRFEKLSLSSAAHPTSYQPAPYALDIK